MFPGIDEGTWIFTKVREARDGEKEDLLAQAKGLQSGEDDAEQGDDDDDDDEEEGEAKEGGTPATAGQGADKKDEPAAQEDMDEDMGEDMGDGIYVEDEGDEEGAVWCMKEGRVIDWGCFFALLYVTISTPPLPLSPRSR